MSGDSDDGAVGYRRPPRHSQFQKGRSGNPHGRPRKRQPEKNGVEQIISEPVTVTVNGQKIEMHPKLVALHSMLMKAKAGGTRYAINLMKQFDAYGAMPKPSSPGGVIVLPNQDMPSTMSDILLNLFGCPPWSASEKARARAIYLANRTDEERQIDELIKYLDLEPDPPRSGRPKARRPRPLAKPPATVEEAVAAFARQKHAVVIRGETRDLATIDLLVHLLNTKAMAGDLQADRYLETIKQRYAPIGGGPRVLLVPGTLSDEEWIRRATIESRFIKPPSGYTDRGAS